MESNNSVSSLSPAKMPTLFLSHGAPTMAIEQSAARDFFLELASRLPQPSAIIIASAHWLSEPVGIVGGSKPLDTIYDFYGFPDELYKMTYPAPGIGQLEDTIAAMLETAGLQFSVDHTRGLDHGAWIPLKLMYPDANIPVTQISLDPNGSPEYHWRLGNALHSLVSDNVLVIGSGTMTHNLGDVGNFHHGDIHGPEADYVIEFSRWMEARIAARDLDDLLAYRDKAPHAARAHPTPEHLMPFYFALGAAGSDWQGELIHRSAVYNVINLDSYGFSVN